MGILKFSSQVDAEVWKQLKAFAAESNRTVSGVLTEALRQYLRRQRVRPQVSEHLEESIRRNAELGRLLAE